MSKHNMIHLMSDTVEYYSREVIKTPRKDFQFSDRKRKEDQKKEDRLREQQRKQKRNF